ncbi:hypothetical protein TPR58_16805 [Sphingomonas sp. HF-S3]|uniref:Uncharacterized protein n=1 Tax=Sphingomonas rustica TaxID=3103142 RepID=A0ABV0BC77_9SPHN
MSRALNIKATVAEVIAMSAKKGAAITAIEPLTPAGTRVVYMNSDQTATIARAYGSRVITGPVVREAWGTRRMI